MDPLVRNFISWTFIDYCLKNDVKQDLVQVAFNPYDGLLTAHSKPKLDQPGHRMLTRGTTFQNLFPSQSRLGRLHQRSADS